MPPVFEEPEPAPDDAEADPDEPVVALPEPDDDVPLEAADCDVDADDVPLEPAVADVEPELSVVSEPSGTWPSASAMVDVNEEPPSVEEPVAPVPCVRLSPERPRYEGLDGTRTLR